MMLAGRATILSEKEGTMPPEVELEKTESRPVVLARVTPHASGAARREKETVVPVVGLLFVVVLLEVVAHLLESS